MRQARSALVALAAALVALVVAITFERELIRRLGLSLDSRSLSWVNAGRPSALLVAGTDHQALASTGPPAGDWQDARTVVTVTLDAA